MSNTKIARIYCPSRLHASGSWLGRFGSPRAHTPFPVTMRGGCRFTLDP